MRLVVFILLSQVLVSMALANEHDQRMAQILEEYKVEPFGKRQRQRARIYCSNSRKKIIERTCIISVDGPGVFAPDIVYEKLNGRAALELSDLLIEYGIHPEGRRGVQNLEISCRLKSKNLPTSVRCRVIHV